MNQEQVLTKEHYNLLTQLEKQSQLIERLKEAIALEEKGKEAIQLELDNHKRELDQLTTEYQTGIDTIESKNEDYEKKIADLQESILPEGEMQFYYLCKADVLMNKYYNSGKTSLTKTQLKQDAFPISLLESKNGEQSGVRTSNFLLLKTDNNNYKLSKL